MHALLTQQPCLVLYKEFQGTVWGEGGKDQRWRAIAEHVQVGTQADFRTAPLLWDFNLSQAS